VTGSAAGKCAGPDGGWRVTPAKGLEAGMAGMRAAPGLRAGALPVAVGLAAGIVAVSCGSTTTPRTGPVTVTTTATTKTTAKSQPYQLYTHCGINEARIGNRYYVAVHPLSDGSGNPPAGWGNPSQAGTMTILPGTEAVFTDNAGHRVVFMVRPGAKTFEHVCS
jgi:hypothetical protein